MRLTQTLCLMAMLLASAPAAAWQCPPKPPMKETYDAASTVFLAVLTSAGSMQDLRSLPSGETYRVDYTFEVLERFKGDPSTVPVIFASNTFWDPRSDLHILVPSFDFAPGNIVLVIAPTAGPVEVGHCTLSERIGSPDHLEEVRSLRKPESR